MTFESEQMILSVFKSYIKFTFYNCYKENGDVEGKGDVDVEWKWDVEAGDDKGQGIEMIWERRGCGEWGGEGKGDVEGMGW
jgi:hypothetical protein